METSKAFQAAFVHHGAHGTGIGPGFVFRSPEEKYQRVALIAANAPVPGFYFYLSNHKSSMLSSTAM